jgi:hypothetical protein
MSPYGRYPGCHTGEDTGGAWSLFSWQDKGWFHPLRFVSTLRRGINDMRDLPVGGAK